MLTGMTAGQLTIGEVADRSGVAASALRFYEERSLIASMKTAASSPPNEPTTASAATRPTYCAGWHSSEWHNGSASAWTISLPPWPPSPTGVPRTNGTGTD